jgi:hypothetical protein
LKILFLNRILPRVFLLLFVPSISCAGDAAFKHFTSNNPGYFSVGFGAAYPVGSATRFHSSVSAAAGAASTNLTVSGDTAVSFSGGYRFASLPLRIGFEFMSLLNDVHPSNAKVTSLGDGSIMQRLYSLDGLYDYAITPNWFVSLGAALGITNFSFNTGNSSAAIVPIRDRYGFAYQAIAQITHRIGGFTLGVSYHFIGTSVSANRIFPTANTSSKLLNQYFGFQVGLMFW